MRNAFYTPQNFLAKLPDGRIVSIDDYIKDNITEEITCPCCNSKMFLYARDSICMQPNFKHEKGKSCLDYKKEEGTQKRRDVFYRREMALTEQEVENYKERIESLEYIYEFVKRIKNESLSPENQKEFLTALSTLNYEDQLWVFNYGKNSSCLKPLKYEMADIINDGLVAKLKDIYGPLGVNILSISTHKIRFEYRGEDFCAGYTFGRDSDYRYKKPLIKIIDEKDLRNLERQVQELLKTELYFNYIYAHKDMFEGEIGCRINRYGNPFIVSETSVSHISESINISKPIETQITDIANSFNQRIKEEQERLSIIEKIDSYISNIDNNFTIEKGDLFWDEYELDFQSSPLSNVDGTPYFYSESYKIDLKDNYKEQIDKVCKYFLSTVNETQKRIENRKKDIIDNAPEIPLNRVKESEKNKNHYSIYCKDKMKEYIIILPKENLLKIEDNFYYVNTSYKISRLSELTDIYSNRHSETLVLSRYLGDTGKFTKEYKIDISKYFPSRNSKNKNEIEITPNDETLEEEYDDEMEM